jgi:hypothetical protein
MNELVLPVFAMDCRDWLVTTPDESGLPDEVAGAPLLAVLSTVVVSDGEFRPASGVLTVGLLDTDRVTPHPLPSGRVAQRIVDPGEDAQFRRYLLPAPDGRLAMLAEFTMPDAADGELVCRIEALMDSFRWA